MQRRTSTLTCVNYLKARELVLEGQRVRRPGWPADAFLLLVPGSVITVEADRPLGQAAPELVGGKVRYSDHIDYYSNGLMSPWAADDGIRDDIHATDWETI